MLLKARRQRTDGVNTVSALNSYYRNSQAQMEKFCVRCVLKYQFDIIVYAKVGRNRK